jgi:hypothetical protein
VMKCAISSETITHVMTSARTIPTGHGGGGTAPTAGPRGD